VTLSVGDLCTVAYADGGFRVALPVEIARAGQQAYLADFGTSQSGVPVRIRTVAEVAATVAENEEHPRLQRVIGTIVRDANSNALFVPLGVMPPPEPETPPATKTFFVVLTDTGPVAGGITGGGGTTLVPYPHYTRKANEYDITREVFPGFESRTYLTLAAQVVHLGGGVFLEVYSQKPITQRTFLSSSDSTSVFTFYPSTSNSFFIANGRVATPSRTYSIESGFGVREAERSPAADLGPRTFEQTIEFIPVGISAFRTSLAQWGDLPAAIVYSLPLASDAAPGTPNDIFPPGITDTNPLEIVSDGYPTASGIVSLLAERSAGEGIREVRFITASATVGGVAGMQTLIGEVIDSLRSTNPELIYSTTAAPGNDWLNALIATAADVPEE
jgi:hypothetical protein